MALTDFIQLGVGGVAVVVAYLIVKEVLKSNKAKDEQFVSFITKQEDSFNEIIKNHLNHDIESRNQLEKSHDKLATMIEQLIKWLEKNNRK